MSIPYVPQGTTKRFRVPRTLAADFDAFLNQDIPNTVMDFELLHNWYDKFAQNYEPVYIRGEIYPDSTKSRYENTDNNMNIRCSLTSGIQKGDMVIEPDGTIFILDWDGHKESNNIPSRALRCNMYLTVYEYKDAETDEEGYIVDDEGYLVNNEGYVVENDEAPSNENINVIVDSLPANFYRYDGRPEYVAVSGTPGTIAGVLTEMTVQFNDQSKNIKIGHYFDWLNNTYEIVDVNPSGVDITGQHGTLRLQIKRAAGGLHGYE